LPGFTVLPRFMDLFSKQWYRSAACQTVRSITHTTYRYSWLVGIEVSGVLARERTDSTTVRASKAVDDQIFAAEESEEFVIQNSAAH